MRTREGDRMLGDEASSILRIGLADATFVIWGLVSRDTLLEVPPTPELN